MIWFEEEEGVCMKQKQTTIKKGQLQCGLYGDITGVDCGTLKDSRRCGGCRVYQAVTSVKKVVDRRDKDVRRQSYGRTLN